MRNSVSILKLRNCLIGEFILFAFLLPILVSAVAESDRIYSFPIRWEIGDYAIYEYEKTEKIVNAKQGLARPQRCLITLRVIEKEDSKWFVTLSWGKLAEHDEPLREYDPADRMFPPFEFEINKRGEVTCLKNWKAIQKLATEINKVTVESRELSAESARELQEKLDQMYATEELVREFHVQELDLLLCAYRCRIKADEVREWDSSIASPIGGEPMPTRLSLRGFSTADANKLIFTLRQNGKVNVQFYDEHPRTDTLYLTEEMEMEVNTNKFWPENVDHVKTVILGEKRSVQRTILKLVRSNRSIND